MARIRLLLLDFDGTLVDTRRANARAYVATLAEQGIRITEEEYLARWFGMRCNEFLTEMGINDPAERERRRQPPFAIDHAVTGDDYGIRIAVQSVTHLPCGARTPDRQGDHSVRYHLPFGNRF